MDRDNQMANKVVITGAASGIGRACAERFAADGYEVCANDVNHAELAGLINSLPPGSHLACPGDYSDPQITAAMDETIRRQWGRADVLVNCAGVFRPLSAIDSPFDEWWSAFEVMIAGALRMTRLVVPLMPDGGRIIHVTSIHADRAERDVSPYAMSKAALNQFCRAAAVELAPRQILVNGIAPGFVRTRMCLRPDGTSELDSDWFHSNYVSGHHLPLRRAAEPAEIAGVAAFLAGPHASYITGQIIVVDGGLTITF